MNPAVETVHALRRAFALQTALVEAGMTTVPLDEPRQEPVDTSPDAHGTDELVAAIEAGDVVVLTDADCKRCANGDVVIKLDTGSTAVTEDHVDLEDMA